VKEKLSAGKDEMSRREGRKHGLHSEGGWGGGGGGGGERFQEQQRDRSEAEMIRDYSSGNSVIIMNGSG